MPKPARFRPTKTATGTWRLNIPAAFSESGRRERFFFPTREKAAAAAAALKEKREIFGTQATAISPSIAEAAVAALAVLEPYGIGLLEAAHHYRAAREAEAASKPTSAAIKLWLADVESKVRSRTLANYRQTSKRFGFLGEKPLSAVTRDELQEIVAPPGMSATSAASHYRVASAFWNWSARRGWCDAAAFDKLEKPAKSQRKKIKFLQPEAAAALLAAAEKHYPQAVGMFAVGLFAGVRPVELTRLDPALVTADGIDVGADESKGISRRFITPCETLAEWLKAHPFVKVANWDRIWDACRRHAGWNVASEFTADLDLPDPTRGPWPQDGMRHTCGTFHVARGTDLAGMAYWFGHTGGEATLRTFYVGKATKKTALEFFALRPGGATAPNKFQPVQASA
jgi:integrase/recombinase XerD